MELSKQVVSLELAKRLKELGVEQESLFYWYDTIDYDDTPRINLSENHCSTCCLPQQSFEEKYSAFTVAELGEMLPERGYHKDGSSDNKEDLAAWMTFKSEKGWICTLTWRYARTNTEWIKADTEADARAKMLIYLLEQKLI